MDFWTETVQLPLLDVKTYKKSDKTREDQCAFETNNAADYGECLKYLSRNWQSFMLKIEWERRRMMECV